MAKKKQNPLWRIDTNTFTAADPGASGRFFFSLIDESDPGLTDFIEQWIVPSDGTTVNLQGLWCIFRTKQEGNLLHGGIPYIIQTAGTLTFAANGNQSSDVRAAIANICDDDFAFEALTKGPIYSNFIMDQSGAEKNSLTYVWKCPQNILQAISKQVGSEYTSDFMPVIFLQAEDDITVYADSMFFIKYTIDYKTINTTISYS